ncbi:MAG: flagellar hook-associated protein FlgK [Brockia lithotrophica]|nr:flagellar hook-associated protein FlgK [Brockia lithotrophica]
MTSTFSGMEIALRGLTAARLSMGVVSHNVANAEVPGYSRQRVDLRAAAPWAYPGLGIGANPAQVGQGVEVRSISRVRDLLLDRQYRTEVGYRSAYDVRRTFLEKLETALADTEGSGLSLVLDRFFHAWQDLSLDAENLSVRQEVLGYAEQLVDLFHHVGDSFTALSQDARDLLRFRVEEVNALVREIADLNREIARITPHGYAPNDLYDERDRLLDRLAQLVDVEVAGEAFLPSCTRRRRGGGEVPVRAREGLCRAERARPDGALRGCGRFGALPDLPGRGRRVRVRRGIRRGRGRGEGRGKTRARSPLRRRRNGNECLHAFARQPFVSVRTEEKGNKGPKEGGIPPSLPRVDELPDDADVEEGASLVAKGLFGAKPKPRAICAVLPSPVLEGDPAVRATPSGRPWRRCA